MALRIRLRRMGRKKAPTYRIVVAENHMPRDGRFVEIIGHYNPRTEPMTLVVKDGRARHWLSVGAKPTDTVRSLLKRAGVYEEPSAIETAASAVASAAGAAAETVRDVAEAVGDQVAEVAETVSEQVSRAVETVGEAVRSATETETPEEDVENVFPAEPAAEQMTAEQTQP